MQRHDIAVTDERGNAVTTYRVTVYQHGTTTIATLYSDNGVTPLANPFDVNAEDGESSFYAANGRYDYTITNGPPGMDDEPVDDVLLYDPANGSADELTDVTMGGTTLDLTPGDNLDILGYDSSTQTWRAMHPVDDAQLDLYFVNRSDYTDGFVWLRVNQPTAAPLIVTQQGTGTIADFRQGVGDGSIVASVTNTGGLSLAGVIASTATGENTFAGDIEIADGKTINSPTGGIIMPHRASTSSLDISHPADVNIFIDSNNNETLARFAVWHNGSVEGSSTVLFDVHETDGVRVYGALVVDGNATFNGTTTHINSTTVDIGDNIIILNSGEAGVPTQNAGVEIERGTSANAFIGWMETPDRFQWSPDLVTYYTIPGLERADTWTAAQTFAAVATFNGGATVAGTGVTVDSDTSTAMRLSLSENITGGWARGFQIARDVSGIAFGAGLLGADSTVTYGYVGIGTNPHTDGLRIYAGGDLQHNAHVIWDQGNVGARINALTTDAAPDGAADYVIFYDSSEGVANKVLINDLVAAGGGGGGGVTDHGALTGLADNDHPQYALVDGAQTLTGIKTFSSRPEMSAGILITGNLTWGGTTITLAHDNGDIAMTSTENLGTELRYNSVKKVETTSTGVAVTGELTATGDVTGNTSDGRLKTQFREFDAGSIIDRIVPGLHRFDPEKCKAAGFEHFDELEHFGFDARQIYRAMGEGAAPLAPFDRTSSGKSRSRKNYRTFKERELVAVLWAEVRSMRRRMKELERARA